ncbi:conjugal transfer protein [Citrobacter amalonaticus]|nr:conjugal transfer protein [Citrobacter amalonaticus]
MPDAVQAETCRAATAATAGRDAGYEQARKAADAWADREGQASDILQDCLSGIRDITVTLPSFPSLSDLLSQAINKVCRAAVDKVNDTLPSNIDPWKDLN